MTLAAHHPVLVGGALGDEAVDHVCAGRATAFTLRVLAAARERRVGPVLLVVVGLGVRALVAGGALHHRRETGGRALHPAFLAGPRAPVVDPREAAGALGLPHGARGVVRAALVGARLVQRLSDAGADRRVALAEAVGVPRMRVAFVGRFVREVAAACPVLVLLDRHEDHPLPRRDGVPAAAFAAAEAERRGHRGEALCVGCVDGPAVVAGVVRAVVREGGAADLGAGRSVHVAFFAKDPGDLGVAVVVDAAKAGCTLTAGVGARGRSGVGRIACVGFAIAVAAVSASGRVTVARDQQRDQHQHPHLLHRHLHRRTG